MLSAGTRVLVTNPLAAERTARRAAGSAQDVNTFNPMTPMTTTPFRRSLLLGTLLGLTFTVAPHLAEAKEPGSGRLKLTPAQQQKLFPEWRRLSQEATQGKIAILQKHQQCIASANTTEAMRACQRQQRQAMDSQRQQQREAMRQLLQRNGITPPQPRQDGGKRRMLGQPDAEQTI